MVFFQNFIPEEDENCQQDEDNILYDDIQIRSKGIKITELQETIKSLAKDKKKGFQEEFHASFFFPFHYSKDDIHFTGNVFN